MHHLRFDSAVLCQRTLSWMALDQRDAYKRIRFLNSGQSSVKVSYSPPSPQT